MLEPTPAARVYIKGNFTMVLLIGTTTWPHHDRRAIKIAADHACRS
jgi:hypothetical protein